MVLKRRFTPISFGCRCQLVLKGFVEQGVKDQKVLYLIKLELKDLPKPVHLSNEKKKKVLGENEAKPDPYWLKIFYDLAPVEALKRTTSHEIQIHQSRNGD